MHSFALALSSVDTNNAYCVFAAIIGFMLSHGELHRVYASIICLIRITFVQRVMVIYDVIHKMGSG